MRFALRETMSVNCVLPAHTVPPPDEPSPPGIPPDLPSPDEPPPVEPPELSGK
jgi:hypothetical protein